LTAIRDAGNLSAIAQKSQQRLLTMGKSSSQRDKANFLPAMAIFSGVRPFTLFADLDMHAFLHALDPTFRPPSHDTIGTRLLDDCYAAVKQSVDVEVDKIEYLNITADESTDIQKRRIANLSVLDRNRSFYYYNKDVGDKRMSAVTTANWIQEQVSLFPFLPTEFLTSAGLLPG
jgi:hypothetical protein